MTPSHKTRSSSDGCEKLRSQSPGQVVQPQERQRSSSSDAKLPSTNRDDSNHNDTLRINSPAARKAVNTSQARPNAVSSRCISDSTNRRTLQTISSGIALDEKSLKSPPYPPPLSPSKGNNSPKCSPYYHQSMNFPLPLVRRKSLDNSNGVSRQQHLRKSPPANSHGGSQWQQFYHMTQHQQGLPPNIPSIDSLDQEYPTHRSQHSHYSIDAGKHGFFMQQQQLRLNHSSGGDGNDSDSAVESIVFHYTPGEVPPAEYALPASILKVYGVDCECLREDMMHSSIQIDRDGERLASSLTIGSDGENNNLSSTGLQFINHEENDHQSTALARNILELLPPEQTDAEQQRVLPYHERKRLIELKQKEGKRNARKEAKLNNMLRGSNNETTQLNNKEVPMYDYEHNQAPGFRLFGQLAALITGKQASQQLNDKDTKHKRYGSIENESKLYRDRGEAFLRKTEKERIKIHEQCKSHELNNVTIPVSRRHSFGHSRANMSSLSNALESIADCSDDEDQESCTSDEETDSSYYTSESQSNTTVSSKRVWTYGDSSVTSKKKQQSNRDRIMERERLLQEEYEFRLHRLTRENQILAKKFRLFVLVAVAFILVAALAFAIVVCFKMLLV